MNKILPVFKIILATCIMVLAYGMMPDVAGAATLYLVSDKEFVNNGDTVNVAIKIDSEGVSINAAQATLQFPKDILEAVSASKIGSVFNFWLEGPLFSNENGQLTFIGGAASGLSGKSLQVLNVLFKVKGIGGAQMLFTEGAITASNGSGTNVLSVMRGTEIKSAAKKEIAPVPAQIIRLTVLAQKLPAKAIIAVPFYPDPAKWYNNVSNFLAKWDLPSDVSDVSTTLNQNILYSEVKSEGLFDSKVFPAIVRDGIWYLHVLLKNSVGWGPVANYRLAIDTEPPLAFKVGVLEGEATDNPAPTLLFSTYDALSGLKEYQIKIDNNEITKIASAGFTGSFTLPLQAPGTHTIVVKAVDQAENSIGDNIVLDILPIPSPVINFITKELFSNEENSLNIKGTALPNVDVPLVLNRESALVVEDVTHTDEKGNWEFNFDQPLRNGNYTVIAKSRDLRGALSLAVVSPRIIVKSRPIIQIGAFQLGKGGALVLLAVIIFAGFGGGVWFYKNRQKKIVLRTLAAENDLSKVFKLISDDVDKLAKFYQTNNTANIKFMFGKLQENMKKMEGHLKAGIDRIKNLF